MNTALENAPSSRHIAITLSITATETANAAGWEVPTACHIPIH
ncbi:MAG TPA: hypothetical protein VGI64_19895 [Streptosporangiaceae bacterium]